jgi:hypothetical protein
MVSDRYFLVLFLPCCFSSRSPNADVVIIKAIVVFSITLQRRNILLEVLGRSIFPIQDRPFPLWLLDVVLGRPVFPIQDRPLPLRRLLHILGRPVFPI